MSTTYLAAYEEGIKDGRADTIKELISLLNRIEDSGVAFRYDRRDLREYFLARLGVEEHLWPLYLEGRVMMTEEEFTNLPQA